MLGEPYQQMSIDLGTDDEGPVGGDAGAPVARPHRPGRAVLYVHGFVDYFFQTHLADFYVERGIDFYAVDLRKYGRSLRQWPDRRTSCRSCPTTSRSSTRRCASSETSTATTQVLVNGHSTGGLTASLWAHRVAPTRA